MKTQLWIDMLAKGAGPAPRAPAAKRFLPVGVLGVLCSAVLANLMLGSVPAAMWSTPVPWMKLAYTGALALSAGWFATRLSKPAAYTTWPKWSVVAVLATMWALGLNAWLVAEPAGRTQVLMGDTWLTCPSNVALLSMPALTGALWAMRGLAPTRLVAAGFQAGLMAGAVGALGYALACPEVSPTFVAVWYTLGMLLTGLLGALVGPWVLRW